MLHISVQHLRDIASHSRRSWPTEACGLLVGSRQAEALVVSAVPPLANQSNDNGQFAADPATVLRIELDAARRGREVLGLYHSHPGGSGYPSREDWLWAQRGYGIRYVWLIQPISVGQVGSPQAWLGVEGKRQFLPEVICPQCLDGGPPASHLALSGDRLSPRIR